MDNQATIGAGKDECRKDGPQAVTVAVRRDDASMLGNRPGPKAAWKYDDRRIEELGLSLEAYFSDPDHLYFESWAASQGLSLRQCRRLLSNPGFREIWERCEAIQCGALLELSSRAVKDDRGSTYFRINPRIAILILQAKFGYVTKEEMTLKTEETDQYAQIEAARRTLQTMMPTSPLESRVWLEGVLARSQDEPTGVAAEQLLQKLDIERDALSAGTAFVDG